MLSPKISRNAFWIPLFVLLASAWPAFSQWRTGYFMQGEAAGQTVSTIPWSKYTHMIHYAIKPTYSNGVCGFNTSYGISGSNITNFVSAARAAGVKSIISIMQDDSVSAIRTCTDSAHISQFVSAITNFVRSNGYDGLDIDWESGVIASQYQNLITRLRAAMPSAVITTAVTVTERRMTAAVQDKLDQINLMAYDLDFSELSGSSINYTWYNAPTYQGSNTRNNAMNILAWYYVSEAGNNPRKIGIGVPFYGRIKRGCRDSSGSTGVTDPNQSWVSGGSRGAILWRDLVNSVYWNNGTRVWDDSRKSQYIRYRGGSCSSDAFIPYTGPEQLRAVVDMIKANNYGGIMTYGLPYEYMAGQSGDARYPLSTAIYNAMTGGGSTVTAPSITTVSTLAPATAGSAYTAQLSASGTQPITWAITGGALPEGMTLSTTSGVISGTCTKAGTSNFTAQATNSEGSHAKAFTLTVNGPQEPEPQEPEEPQEPGAAPVITTASLPAGTVGTAYSFVLTASTTSVQWSLPGGSLPPGLWLAAGNGAITGTPTSAGAWNFTVGVANGSGTTSKSFTLTINSPAQPPQITSSSLPAGTVGTAYSFALAANSTTPVEWSLPGGSLPPGLWLAASSGTISGTPSSAGTWTFTARASNSAGATSRSFTLTVNAPAQPPRITTSSVPAGTVGTAYSFALAANSPTPVQWSLPGGSLPPGLWLAAGSGAIAGTPSAAGTWNFTVRATNSAGSTTQSFSLTVGQTVSLSITTPSLPRGYVGSSYSLTLRTTSTTPVQWSLPAGSLPPGLWLAAGSGAITGTPTARGDWTFTVAASNGQQSDSRTYRLSIRN